MYSDHECQHCHRRLTRADLEYEHGHQPRPTCGHRWSDYHAVPPPAKRPTPAGESLALAYIVVGVMALVDLVAWFLQTYMHFYF